MIIHNKGNYVRHIGAMLVPGVTQLSPDQAEAFNLEVKYPLNQYLIDSKEIEIVKEETADPEETKVAASISELGAEKAIELVKDTFDLSQLGSWGTEEAENKKRKTVLEAINAQIDSIENPNPDDIAKTDE